MHLCHGFFRCHRIYKVRLNNQHIHHPCNMYCLLIWYRHHIYHHVGHNSSRCHVYSSTFLRYMQTDDSRDKLQVLRDANDFDYSRNIIKSIIIIIKKFCDNCEFSSCYLVWMRYHLHCWIRYLMYHWVL